MAIEIVPKPTPKIPISTNILLYMSLLVLIAVVSSYFVLSSFIKKDAKTTQEIDEQMAKVKTPEEASLANEVMTKKKKIDEFSQVIREHKFPSKFFGFFAGLIHPKVQISNFSLDVKNSQINISGLTESFTTLEQQLMIFQKESSFKGVSLSSFAADKNKEGKISFSFDISFDPNVFNK